MNIRGAQVLGLKPEVFPGLLCTALFFHEEEQPCTLLACVNGAHAPGSTHYAGFAFDIDLPKCTEEEMLDYEQDLGVILGAEYTVLFQGTHLHIHWSPRTGVNRT